MFKLDIKITNLVITFVLLISIYGCKFPLEEEYHTDESIKNDNNSTSRILTPPYP